MPLRTIVTVPAHGAGLDEALASAADGIAFTLTDASVPIAELRRLATEGLSRVSEARKAAFAFVNHPRTRMLRDDIEALAGPNLKGVLLPHAVEPQDARDAAVTLREFELQRELEPGTIALYPVIDSARGLLRAYEIAIAAPRVAGLIFDSRGYARDVGARDEENGPRLSYARGGVVAAARAAGGVPLVVAEPLQLGHLAQYGFEGALLADGRAAGMANAAFTPTAAEAELAREQVAAYDAARADGDWVARLGPGVVDAQTARRARGMLD